MSKIDKESQQGFGEGTELSDQAKPERVKEVVEKEAKKDDKDFVLHKFLGKKGMNVPQGKEHFKG